MSRLGTIAGEPLLSCLLLCGTLPLTALGGDLSRYRDFHFGSDLQTVSKQTGVSATQARVIHTRPALLQELEWRPQPLGPATQTEPAKDVVFSFYDGQLYRIVVNYDRYETEGLTPADIAGSISAAYGDAVIAPALAKGAESAYGEQEEALARWEDPQYRFDLVRSSYGPSYKLIGVLKKLEAPSQAANLEAVRLDDQEAPQRDAARLASEEELAKATLQKARLVNKPKFRP